MKIVDKQKHGTRKRVRNLARGTTFTVYDTPGQSVYMVCIKRTDTVDCVDIATGDLLPFDVGGFVYPVKCELHILGKE